MRGRLGIFEEAAETLIACGVGLAIAAASALMVRETPAFFALIAMAAGCFAGSPAVLVVGLWVGSRKSAVGSRKGE